MSTRTKIIIAIALITLGVLGRLLPHLWNFTPIVAIALVSAVYLGNRYAYLAVLSTLLISDFFIGFYDIKLLLVVYGSFLLAGGIGYIIQKYKSVVTMLAGSLLVSTVFYAVTNFAVWKFSPFYEKTFEGLMLSYTLALPFFRNALVGDLFYTLVLFGVFESALYFVRRKTKVSNIPLVISQI